MDQKSWTDELGLPVETADGSFTLKHPDHGEDYHSKLGAIYEARSLYVERSGILKALEDRTSDLIAVLDVGLGLGYNVMATLDAWYQASNPPDLYILSLEINPELVRALTSGEAPWMANWSDTWRRWCQGLRFASSSRVEGEIIHPKNGAKATWRIAIGDAKQVDLSIAGGVRYNYIWQDAFSPQKNPTLWGSEWFTKVKAVAAPNAVLMTYSVARMVKDGLTGAGWHYERIPGPAQKKHWLKAINTI